MSRKSQPGSRGLLELSVCWTPEEVGSNTHEGVPQLQADEFTSEDEGKAGEKQEVSTSTSLYVACHRRYGKI